MSKRLQVLLPFREYARFKKIAGSEGLSLGAWVRNAMRQFASKKALIPAHEKLMAVREASRWRAPVADIGQMLKEIETGYLGA